MGFDAQISNQDRYRMKRIFVPTRSGSDWQPLLAEPIKHWKKGRSAMTAAACWEATPSTLPPEIAAAFVASGDPDLIDVKLLVALPEWTVPLIGGDTASQTDVLALAANDRGLCVVAVEAKVDEDFGPLLGQKRKDASPGQIERLGQLHGLLGVQPLPDTVRYQLLHRTASAILTAREFHAHAAMMLVHSFGRRQNLRDDFDAFGRAIDARELSKGVMVVATSDAPRLFLVWCDGDTRFLQVELPSLFSPIAPASTNGVQS
jgi:hypothetical protein